MNEFQGDLPHGASNSTRADVDSERTAVGSAGAAHELITRRESLAVGAAAVTSLGTRAVLGDVNGASEPAWIDAHVHVWTDDVRGYPLAPNFRPADMQPARFLPDDLWAHARPCGVGRIVLIQMSYYTFDNRYMLDVIAQQPGSFRGVAIVDPEKQPAQEMKRLRALGVRGIRIQPDGQAPDRWLAHDGMHQMWKAGADLGIAMCHLIDARYLESVRAMAQRFPQTPIVIDHFARIGVDGEIRAADLDQLCRLADFPQVSVKVSAFYALGKKSPPYTDLLPMIDRLVQVYGCSRLMWASDCPFQIEGPHTYRASLELIEQKMTNLSAENRAWLLQKTAERVFFGD